MGCRGHKFKSLLKLSNGWTDWHQIWHTCVQIHLGMDIRHTNCHSRHKGGHLGVLGGQTFKSLEKLSNGWTDWHQLWFTSADSYGNGHRLNSKYKSPHNTAGDILVGFRGSQIQMSGEAIKLLDRFAPNLVHVCRFVWEWTKLDIAKYNSPLNTTGCISEGLGGHKFKSGKGAKRMDRLAPNSVHVCGFIWEWT